MSFFSSLIDAAAGLLRQLFGGSQEPAPAPGPAAAPPPLDGEQPAAPLAPEQPAGAGPRRINAAGLALVKESEGLRLVAYRDTGGVWTIGYGHTAGVGASEVITTATAALLLEADLTDAERAVASWDDAYAAQGISRLTDNQFSALCDFCFNLGAGALRQLLAHGLDQVPAQLLRWDHGKVAGQEVELAGLKRRREREAALWGQA